MSKKLFTDDEIEQLNKNQYVLRVSTKAITYTDEFKTLFIAEYQMGKKPREIFKLAGFDPQILGQTRIKNAAERWRKAYAKSGVMGLRDTRKENLGRPRVKEMTKDEIIQKKDAKIAYLQAEIELLKKLELGERQVKSRRQKIRYTFEVIHKIITYFSLKGLVKYLCTLAGVSRSGYYNFISTLSCSNQQEMNDALAKKNILKAFNYKGYAKGSRGIQMTLKNIFGITYNRKRIQRIMKKFNIVCPHRKPNPYKRMAKATKEHRVVPNLLKRNFKQNVAGKVLLTDITYLPYQDGFAYLSTIKDGSTNEILSYHLSKRITLDIAITTIHKLMKHPSLKLHEDAFIHSDQGVHYTSPKFQNLLKKMNLGQSMSRRGNCWDNAPQESFYGHMKDEMDYKNCNSFEELSVVVDDYMDYYNNHRFQWNLKKLTPVGYRNQLLVA